MCRSPGQLGLVPDAHAQRARHVGPVCIPRHRNQPRTRIARHLLANYSSSGVFEDRTYLNPIHPFHYSLKRQERPGLEELRSPSVLEDQIDLYKGSFVVHTPPSIVKPWVDVRFYRTLLICVYWLPASPGHFGLVEGQQQCFYVYLQTPRI